MDVSPTIKFYLHVAVGAIVSYWAMQVIAVLLGGYAYRCIPMTAAIDQPNAWLLATEAGRSVVAAFAAIGVFACFVAWNAIQKGYNWIISLFSKPVLLPVQLED